MTGWEVWPPSPLGNSPQQGCTHSSPAEGWDWLQPPPPSPGSGLIPQIDETVSSGTRAAIIIRLIEDEWLNWLVDQKEITPAILRGGFQNLVWIIGVSKEYYDMFMPAILSRPYALSPGCLADPGQPSTHARPVGPSAQNLMGRIQLCRRSCPKSHSKQHNQEPFEHSCAWDITVYLLLYRQNKISWYVFISRAFHTEKCLIEGIDDYGGLIYSLAHVFCFLRSYTLCFSD